MKSSLTAAVVLPLLLAACAAQPRLPVADPTAATPPVVYRPSLGAAVAEGGEAPASWPAANAEMQRLGGHMGHFAPGGEPAGGAHRR